MKIPKKKYRGFLFLGLAVFAGLLSCKKSKETERPLIFARPADSLGMDPASYEDGETLGILPNIFETLVRFKDGSNEIEAGLAEKWELSADHLRYRFYLRSNIQFHDGSILDADSVIFSFKRQMDPTHPAYTFAGPYKYWNSLSFTRLIKNIKKISDSIIEIELSEPNSTFISNLAQPFMSVVSPKALLAAGKTWNLKPSGTGPYTLKSWRKDELIELEAFPSYWGEKPKIKNIKIRVIPDAQIRLQELRLGVIDLLDAIPLESLATFKNDSKFRILEREGQNIGFMAINFTKPPLHKIEVRKALSMAIDRDRLIREVFQGYAVKATQALPPSILGYNPNISPIPFSPEEAKKILVASGEKIPSLEIWAMPIARPYNPNAQKMAEFIQSDLRRIGVPSKIITYDWGTYIGKTSHLEHQLCLLGWTGVTGDPDGFIWPLWSKSSAEQIPTQNLSAYKNQKLDEILILARKEHDRTKRGKLYAEANKILMDDFVFLPIAHSKMLAITKADTNGFILNPSSMRRFNTVYFH